MLLSLAVMSLYVVIGGVLSLICYGLYSVVQEYRADRVPALLYHQFISKEKVDKGEIVHHERVYVCYDTAFEEQMAFLHRNGYTTISLNDFLGFQDGKVPLPPKPIILTFDDGFMSNFTYAFPILKKYGQKATIFVTPDSESPNFKKYAAVDAPLTLAQIKEMNDYGISIESHGMTHRYLTEMEPKRIKWELEESKATLEHLTQNPVRFLAIPSGAYDRTVKRIAQEVGYQAVFCMLKGSNNRDTDRYALRRLVVARDFSLNDFEKMLTPWAATHLRITSFFQNLLLSLLGPARLDAFRNNLYRSKVGEILVQGQLRYFVGGLAAIVIVTMFFGFFLTMP